MIVSDHQLSEIITEFRRALDKRPPESFCQVSPRAVAVALHHFERLQQARQEAAGSPDAYEVTGNEQ